MSIWAQVPQWVGAAGGITGVVALSRFHLDKRAAHAAAVQGEAEAAESVTQAAMMLLEPLEKELTKTRAEAAKLRQDVIDLRAYVALLMRVLDAAGLPVPNAKDKT